MGDLKTELIQLLDALDNAERLATPGVGKQFIQLAKVRAQNIEHLIEKEKQQ